MTDKKSIMILLNEIADMLDFKGENSFKVAAYRKGAAAIRSCEENIDDLIKQKNLKSIKGIGKGLQSVIYEFCESGTSSLYKELRADVPEGIEQLLKIKGLSAKKIRTLYDELGITSVGELEYACRENRLLMVKGFGETIQSKILKEIDNLKKYSNLIMLSTGFNFAAEISSKIKGFRSLRKILPSGELRRGMEIVSHIEFVVMVDSMEDFVRELDNKFIYDLKGSTLSIKEHSAVPITLYLTDNTADFFMNLFRTTGSTEFLQKILNGKSIKGKNEEDIFRNLDFPYVIPEMREQEYFDFHSKKNSDLHTGELKGFLHFHTTWSDGRDTLPEMLNAAAEKGYNYAAVCDHSRSAVYANGLNEKRISLQNKEIHNYSNNKKIIIIQGIESDILQNGSLDYPEEILSQFGFVVASIHQRYKMDENSMTSRMIKAVENPYTDLLAHPSGRLLLSRDPYEFDVKKVIDACAANQVALEINSNPRRLDLDWRYIDYAGSKGCLFAINSDAHSIAEIDLVEYGVIQGRKGGLQSQKVINCFNANEFYKFVNRKVNRKNIW